MVAEILSVGTELLLGQIVNSDAQYLSRRLSELGINVYHHTTVGDNPARVREALRQALGRSDLVITTAAGAHRGRSDQGNGGPGAGAGYAAAPAQHARAGRIF